MKLLAIAPSFILFLWAILKDTAHCILKKAPSVIDRKLSSRHFYHKKIFIIFALDETDRQPDIKCSNKDHME